MSKIRGFSLICIILIGQFLVLLHYNNFNDAENTKSIEKEPIIFEEQSSFQAIKSTINQTIQQFPLLTSGMILPSGLGNDCDSSSSLDTAQWNGGRGDVTFKLDSNDNFIVTGGFNGQLTLGTFTLTSVGACDFFIAKIDSNGTWLWALSAGSFVGSIDGYFDSITDIEINSNDDIYISGLMGGADGTNCTMDLGGIILQGTSFVAKINATGSVLWANSMINARATSLSITSTNEVFVTGIQDYTAYFGSIESSHTGWGGEIFFVSKVNANGFWEWVTTPDNGSSHKATSIAVDSNDNAVISIYLSSTANLDFGNNNFFPTGTYEGGSLVAKIDNNGNWLWADVISNRTFPIALDINSNDEIIVTGVFYNNLTLPNQIINSTGDRDLFVVKYSSTGLPVWYSTGGGVERDAVSDIHVDNNNDVYILGHSGNATFGNYNLRVPHNSLAANPSSINSMFLVKLSDNGAFVGLHNTSNSRGYSQTGIALELDNQKNIYLATNLQITHTSHTYPIEVKFGNTTLSSISSSGGPALTALFKIIDEDFDQIINSMDNCLNGDRYWNSSIEDYDQDGCRDITEDDDDDGDGVLDIHENCMRGQLNWDSNSTTDYDLDGCQDLTEDGDDDNDGIEDISDLCQTGYLGWTSIVMIDFDGDGCHDSIEDNDDDNDDIIDSKDYCITGEMNWTSDIQQDYDSDGCRDSTEDPDDDNDIILDVFDLCSKGDLNWTSYISTDYDSDGCQDLYEDLDDDNDIILDVFDLCPKGDLNWTSYISIDYDSDGCQDFYEDLDDDNDGILDNADSCLRGTLEWLSSNITDHDSDGCNDGFEDDDDDNDDVLDENDSCSKGQTSWISGNENDYDSDGCLDSIEDDDDDDDGIIDLIDNCSSNSQLNWISNNITDFDSDGCLDSNEDLDDDNDGTNDVNDDLPFNPYEQLDTDNDTIGDNQDEDDDGDDILDVDDIDHFLNFNASDYDGDGVIDSSDDDDDNDGLQDEIDYCQKGDLAWLSNQSVDYDNDGCQDVLEDLDDDNDGVFDINDLCSKGQQDWTSNNVTDFDSDGCQDLGEDTDDDNDGYTDSQELSEGSDPLDSSSIPVEPFALEIGQFELNLWDLLGIFAGLTTSGFLAFAFLTRKGRYDSLLTQIDSMTEENLLSLERKLELYSFFRLLSPRQSIRLESKLDEHKSSEISGKIEAIIPQDSLPFPDISLSGVVDEDGYEWLEHDDGTNWYRAANTKGEWSKWED